jgi:hypothetical protein
MATIHATVIGDKAVLLRTDLERLLELARRCEAVDLHVEEEDLPTLALMRLAELGGAFDFWKEAGEDIYSVQDGEPI